MIAHDRPVVFRRFLEDYRDPGGRRLVIRGIRGAEWLAVVREQRYTKANDTLWRRTQIFRLALVGSLEASRDESGFRRR